MSQMSHANNDYWPLRIVVEALLFPVLLPIHIFFGCLGGASKKKREERKRALQKIKKIKPKEEEKKEK